MRTSRNRPRRAALRPVTRWAALFGALLLGLSIAPTAGAGHPYAGGPYRAYDSFAWGLSLGYPSPYRGYRRGYGYYPGHYPGYGPSYLPGVAGSIGLGYSNWGHGDSWGLALSLPLFIGPRYAPPPAVYGPPAQVLVPAAQSAPRQAPPDCLQIREYQTEIVIDGRVVPAYGSACLQADGSWKVVSGPFAADD